jgi:FtsH-binding integral membrane protein
MRYEEEDKFAHEKAHEAVSRDKGLQQHLANVYGVLMGTVGVSALGAVGAMVTPLGAIHPLIPGLGALVPWLYMSWGTSPGTHSSAFRGGLLGTGAFMSGMAMAPILGMATSIDPMIVPSALLATTGMFGVMSASALALPKGRMSSLGAPLFGGMIGLLGVGIVGIFTPPTSPWYPILHSVHLYGGLGIFSLYIAYDTQMMIQDYEEGNRDTMQAALNMFINVKIVFQRFLMIFIGRSD